jgi:hypothetical protein
MILHQMRHGRQDNHAIDHARWTKRGRQGKAEGMSGPKTAKPYYSQTCGLQRLQSKAWEKSMLMGEAQPLGTGESEPGCEQTRKDDQGRLHPSP